MSVAAILMVRDEADIIEATVRHLAGQVDVVLVNDNLSTDGTLEILLALEGELDGKVLVERDNEAAYYQDKKMSRLAADALALGFDWVVPCDADELWVGYGGLTLAEHLGRLAPSIGTVRVPLKDHVASGADDPDEPNPVRRIQWRREQPGPQQFWKVACRTRPDLRIAMGNHAATSSSGGRELIALGELQIHHYPYRSPAQFISKARNGAAALALTDLPEWIGTHWRDYGRALETGGEQALVDHFYAHFYAPDPVAAGLVHDDWTNQ